MADLISLDRAKAQIPTAGNCSDATVAALVSACSEVVENYCRRTFARDTHDELLHGTGTPYLFVSNPPISRVNSVRTGQLPAVYLQYADPQSQTQSATVDVTETSVVLSTIYNTATTTNEFPFASYPTFGSLATAVNALNSNWKATQSCQFALWQTSDLTSNTGSYGARNQSVPLTVFWGQLGFFKVNEALGEIYTPGGFVPGYQNYRVSYVGGYAEIPEDVQQAVAELVQQTFATLQANPLMQSETLDKYSYTRAATSSFAQLSATSRAALNTHKLMRVARYK